MNKKEVKMGDKEMNENGNNIILFRYTTWEDLIKSVFSIIFLITDDLKRTRELVNKTS